ncbi:MAG: M15 family metallopeptidase [Treponema sp.]|jgi:D-alanyl-D-alanine carboxypeptidase|nr:M15 family metallopeptidase [Treponema sp.]
MTNRGIFLLFMPLILGYTACSKPNAQNSIKLAQNKAGQPIQQGQAQYAAEADTEQVLDDFLGRILGEAGIPEQLSWNILHTASQGPAFIMDLLAALDGDPYLRALVDKGHALPAAYEPDDLVELTGGSYQASRRGLMLRRSAALALEEMSAAARVDGVTLIASSTYRPYTYQIEVYNRNVRESARPGHSQHQLGLVIDFGSIDNSFAETKAGRWILTNAGSFGWSLSFPDGYEEITGYRWESWHYRYVGRELAYFINTYFEGIQQYALQFIYAWEKAGGL